MRTEIIPGISDHDIVFVEMNITPTKLKQKPRQVPIYKKANWETMKLELDNLYLKLAENANKLSTENLWTDFKFKV